MSKSISNLGRHFIVGLQGCALTDQEKRLLAQLKPAGVVFFKKNILAEENWREQLRSLQQEILDCTEDSNLLLSIDHEGGRVHRFYPDQVTHFPEAMTWHSDTATVGQAMGRELHALGFNLNYAPVLDVFSNPQNTVIAQRAFGRTPQEVIGHAAEFIRAMEAEGVLSCGKHFPGHGDTAADSHEQLPTLDKTKKELLDCELLPFKAAIEQNLVKMMMTAHVLYPQLDSDYPATMSKKIVTGLLREELGYRGLVISDALEMKALAATPIDEMLVHTLNAGVDLLLLGMPTQMSAVETACVYAEKIATKIARGEIDGALLEEAGERVRQTVLYCQLLNKSCHA